MHSKKNRRTVGPGTTNGWTTRRDMLALALGAVVAPRFSWAQDFPNKPIRLMVGFAPGGGVDVSARLLAPRLSELLNTPVIVENKAGATGMICSEYVAKSAPDGYTLMYTGGSAVTIAPQLVAKPPVNSLTDLIPVNLIGESPLAVSMNPASGIRTLPELLAQARTRELKIASAGAGTLTHLTIELLSQATGNGIVHVPYKGGGAALVDALAGHVDGMVSDIPPVLQQYQEGKLVPAAITSAKRFELLPAVQTINEAIPGFVAGSWNGVFAPKGTPPAIVEAINAALVKAVARDDVAAQLKKAGIVPATMPSTDAFRKYVANEYARWGKLVKEKNITAA